MSEALSKNGLHHRPDEGLAVLSGGDHEREVLLGGGHLLLLQGNDLEHLRKAERNRHHLQGKDHGLDPPKVGKNHLLHHGKSRALDPLKVGKDHLLHRGKSRALDPLKKERDRLRPVGNGQGRQGNGPHLRQERGHDRGHRKGRDLAVQGRVEIDQDHPNLGGEISAIIMQYSVLLLFRLPENADTVSMYYGYWIPLEWEL